MANLVEWIESSLEEGEVVKKVIIGELGWGDYGSEKVPQYNTQIRGKLLSWEVARPMLDYEFDDGFGYPGCNAITVWTNKNVYWITQYDGSTNLNSVPRNPVAYMPTMPGG